MIIELVLATDLKTAFGFHTELKTAALTDSTADFRAVPMNIMRACIKAADVGHPAKARQIHMKWTALVVEEAFLQGDEERRLGIQVSVLASAASSSSHLVYRVGALVLLQRRRRPHVEKHSRVHTNADTNTDAPTRNARMLPIMSPSRTAALDLTPYGSRFGKHSAESGELSQLFDPAPL